MATVYGYARVSTHGQAKNGNSLEVQEQTLTKNGATKLYIDHFTGTKNDRPELDELLAALRPGDTLIVTKLDRMARNLLGGLQLLESLAKRKVRVNILNMGTFDDTPTGRLQRHLLLAIAEFERDMIVERTKEGKAIAKMRPDFTEGRPKVYTPEAIAHAVELLKTHSYKQVSEMTQISKSTLQRAKREATATNGDGEV